MPYRYTDPNTRAVYSKVKGTLNQAGKIVKFWANAAGTAPIDVGLWSANIPDTPGASIGSNQLTVQADSMWPAMWDRSGALDHMWIQVGTADSPGDLYLVYCDADQRADELAARVAALEPGGGSEAASVTALTAEATARANADAQLAPKTRTITAGTGLTGGGDLSTDRTLSVTYGATAGTAAQGNDSRLSDARPPTAHAASHASAGSDPITVAQSQVTGLAGSLAAKADLVGGVIPTAQIPAIALTVFLGAVGSQAAMLALTGQPGDWATRTDTGTTWQITGFNSAQLSSWTQLLTPADAVSSVNGQIGPVVLAKSDVGLGNVDNTSDANKPLSTATVNALAGKVAKDALVVNVEDYAVGNANFLSGGIWYADAGLTTVATNDTAAIRALVTAGAKHLTFGSRRYRIQWTEGTSFLSWANANGITIEGHGAALCDTTTYTVSPANPYTPVFEFDACANIKISGVDYVGPAIASPLANHGYVGATYVRVKNGCRNIQVDATITNARYGVESGAYPTESEGYNKNFRLNLRCFFVGYPMAHYLAENIRFDIDADDVHRVAYTAGCIDVQGVARWKNEYVADTCFLITDAKTGTGTSRGCSDFDVASIDKGSTVFQPSSACAGIGLSRVDPGIVFENIKIRVHSTSTDVVSSTVGGFKLYSGAASLTTPPAPFNWEPSIIIRNVEVSGLLDHSAQTIEGNTAGDVFVRAWDTSSAHAATIENLSFRDLIIKQSSGNTRGLYLEAPGIIGNGVVFDRVQAPGAKLNIYTSTTVPTSFLNSAFAELIGLLVTPRLVSRTSSIAVTSGTVVAIETYGSKFAGGGFLQQVKVTELALSGSAVTWTGAIPAGSLPLGLAGIITETITGATGLLIGVGTDSSRYLNTNTTTAGFTFGPSNQAVTEQTPWWAGPSTLNINITAKGSNFTGGKIRLVFSYFEFQPPTS